MRVACHKALRNSLTLVSHQVLPLHTMRAGWYYHYSANSWQVWWQDDHHSLSVIVEGFFWMLCTKQTRFLALRSLLCSWHRLLICWRSLICAYKNNGDKFCHQKSMRMVDEKLIINELGSKCKLNQVMSSTNEKVLLGTDFTDMHRC